ncbi:hypothetical protein Acr_00g0044690 [Actinidia rufa]|uniref:Uncharacterized protein n=1 Tax=Actinidia rufa TaxID=165716 RepID=A0A7J0DIZ1_9ERIC|nr:hypothetical protein Acr_00g0044690 [Actinidia rufa]
MTKSPKSSPSNSPHYHTNGTVPSSSSVPPPSISNKSSTHQSPLHSNASFSQPHLVDLATCNHQRVWRSVTRTLRRYLMCFKPEEPRTKEKGKSNVLENGGDRKSIKWLVLAYLDGRFQICDSFASLITVKHQSINKTSEDTRLE